jgi:hypothetical protein
MSRVMQLAATVVAGTLLVAVVALAGGFRLHPPPGAAPSAPNESAARVPTVAVVDAAEPPQTPDAPAEPPNAECMTVVSSVDRVPMTLEGRLKTQDGAVLATVLDVGPAQWNTPDGEPPADIHDVTASDVIRLVRLSADQVWSGDIADTFTTSVVGGRIGCWNFVSDEVPEVLLGKQFAIFFLGSPNRAGLEGVRSTVTLWPVDEEGRIVTPEDGRLTAAEFTQRVDGL